MFEKVKKKKKRQIDSWTSTIRDGSDSDQGFLNPFKHESKQTSLHRPRSVWIRTDPFNSPSKQKVQ